MDKLADLDFIQLILLLAIGAAVLIPIPASLLVWSSTDLWEDFTHNKDIRIPLLILLITIGVSFGYWYAGIGGAILFAIVFPIYIPGISVTLFLLLLLSGGISDSIESLFYEYLPILLLGLGGVILYALIVLIKSTWGLT